MHNGIRRMGLIALMLSIIHIGMIPAMTNASYHDMEVRPSIEEAADWLDAQSVTMPDWQFIAAYSTGRDEIRPSSHRAFDASSLVISTNVQRRVMGQFAMGASPLDDKVQEGLRMIRDAQRENGKFADEINGTGEDLINAHIWGILTLYAGGASVPHQEEALDWLKNQQNEDGGFSVSVASTFSDVDMTAMALMAFHALQVPRHDPAVQQAWQFIEDQQTDTGGFSNRGQETSETTATVIQAIIAYGSNPQADSWIKKDRSPTDGLLTFQQEDGGFAHLKRGRSTSNQMATIQALMALGDIESGSSWLNRLRKSSIKQRITDVSEHHPAYSAILRLAYLDRMTGFPDGTFRPDDPLTRAQFTKILLGGSGDSQGVKQRFTDVPRDHWAHRYVSNAVRQGWIQGVGDDRFAPNQTLNWGTALTMVTRSRGFEEEAQRLKKQGTPWYDGFVRYAKTNGWVDATIRGEDIISRGQTAQLFLDSGLVQDF